MNAEDQRVRHLAIERVNRRIDDLAAAIDDEVKERFQEIRMLIARVSSAEHAERIAVEQDLDILCREAQRTIRVQTEDIDTLGTRVRQFHQMSFTARLCWLVLGRVPIPEAPTTPTAQSSEEQRPDPEI